MAIVDDIKKTWSQTGVSILSDGWKDMRGRQLVNFLVNNPYGTVFLKSIDVSDMVKDANLMFNLLDDVVEEIGEDLVVQVVTDNASNYKKAGEMLMTKGKHLWWTPCAAHCIDLMLEKIGELPQHKRALLKARKVSNFIYNHGWVLVLMRSHTNKELVRPALTRFATAYLTLQSMYNLRKPLETMFSSKEWQESTWSNKPEGKAVRDIIFRDRSFWGSVSYALKTTKPIVNMLRMVDSENVPAMGFIYDVMDKAKEEIARNFEGNLGAYKEIWDIIDEKWEFQLHRHLPAAAYFLNPQIHYSENPSTHPEIRRGFLLCVEKLIADEEDKIKVHVQMDVYQKKDEIFGYTLAKNTVFKRSPVDWWHAFGVDTPELASFVVRILSLTCSSSACERNWSAFNMIHTKKRNRLHSKNLNDLVYIMYNRRLQHRYLRKNALKPGEDPLVISDEMPSDCEWVNDESLAVDMSQPSGSRQRNRKSSTKSRRPPQLPQGDRLTSPRLNRLASPFAFQNIGFSDYKQAEIAKAQYSLREHAEMKNTLAAVDACRRFLPLIAEPIIDLKRQRRKKLQRACFEE